MGADEPFTRYYVAGAWALLGEKERALDALERAASQRRAYTVARARIDPDFENLRGEARFRALTGDGPETPNGLTSVAIRSRNAARPSEKSSLRSLVLVLQPRLPPSPRIVPSPESSRRARRSSRTDGS